MGKGAVITRVPFNEAKSNLSSFVSDVVRHHSVRLLERGRSDPEAMLAIQAGDLLEGLKGCRIDARVTPGEGDSFVAFLPQFGLAVSGGDFDAAIDALHAELVDYCEDYFGDFESYRLTDRIAHLPFLLRFALTPDERRRDLLLEEPTGSPTLAPAEGALAATR